MRKLISVTFRVRVVRASEQARRNRLWSARLFFEKSLRIRCMKPFGS